MNQEVTEDKIAREKLKLHIKYIIFMAAVCVMMVVILSFCEDTMFKNCVSVTSTVTSIILSVIAIILSVTGERTTNEIRNKVSDSVERLESCSDKSSELAVELTETLQQLNSLYENMNDRIVKQFPDINDLVKSVDSKNENESKFEDEYIDKKSNSISDFLNILPKHTRKNIKKALVFMKVKMVEEHSSFQAGDVMKHLVENGAETQNAVLVTGMVLGYLSSGVLNRNGLNKLIEKIKDEEQE